MGKRYLSQESARNHYRFRYTLLFAMLGSIIFLTIYCQAAYGNLANILEQKMADISLLNDQLSSKKLQTILLREKLHEKKEELKSEIIDIKKKYRIKKYYQARKYPRIKYNLILIQEILGYIDGFNEKIRHYQIGNDKLGYLLQQTEDEYQLLKALNDIKIEALTSQIELVMEQYLAEAHTILLTPEDFILKTPEEIWKQIVLGKL